MNKEKGMKHIERHLSFKRMKNQKTHSIQIVCVAILACILMQLAFQLTAGIVETFKEQKKDIYGEWERILSEVDAPTKTVVNDNPFLESKGEIKIYGVLEGDHWENKQSNIGTMNDAAWKCGRLRLKEGRLPQNNREIAMEYSMLAALGYEKKLGEEITLRIIPSVESGVEVQPKELVYTLCGIIKDYQVNWETSTRNRLPTGIVTPKGAKKIGTTLETHMLIVAKEGYESVYEELKNSEEISCGIGENFNEGSLVTDHIPFEQFLKFIRLLSAGAAICILFITISHSIDERSEFWTFLHALGMKEKQMYGMITWEAGMYGAIAVAIGTVGGIILYKVIWPIVGDVIGTQMVMPISYHATVRGVLYGVLIISISYFFSCMRLNIILKEGGKRKKKARKQKPYVISRLTPCSLIMHQWRYAGTRKVIQILLLSSTLVIFGLGLIVTNEKNEDLKIFKQMTGNGYSLDTETIANSSGIRIKTAQAIAQVAGVESVEIYHSNGGYGNYTIDLSEYSDSQYYEEVSKTEQIYREDAAIDKVWLSILGVNVWEDVKRFARNVSEGAITQSDLERGDFCILLLPPLVKTPEGYLGNVGEDALSKDALIEDELKVGDMLKIAHWNTNGEKDEQKIPVDAILRTSKTVDIRSPYPGGSGIQIIVGRDFWERYERDKMKEYCQMVRINVTENADIFDTEKHIMRNIKRIGTVNFHSYHQEYTRRQQELYSFIGMYSIFVIFYMILSFIILYQMLEADAYERKKSTVIFKALGMENSFLIKVRRAEIMLMVFLSLVGSVIVLGCYYGMKIMMK